MLKNLFRFFVLALAVISCYGCQTNKLKLVDGNQKKEEVNKLFSFAVKNIEFRYVKFDIKGTLKLFDWHPVAGGRSWVFADEIVVR